VEEQISQSGYFLCSRYSFFYYTKVFVFWPLAFVLHFDRDLTSNYFFFFLTSDKFGVCSRGNTQVVSS
jgi:hypothetical protein